MAKAMRVRVAVKPALLRWARNCAGLQFEQLARRFPRLFGEPSANLLDTLSLCRQRQNWYRNFARSRGDKALAFVGSPSLRSDISATAAAMRSTLGLDMEERRQIPSWEKALRRCIDQADALGILVMVNGVVGNNSRSGYRAAG